MVKRLHILLLVIFGCLMSVSAADNPKPVSYQYWLDSNFDARVTGDIVNDDDRRVKIPEEYFNGLSNGLHTLFMRAKDENGNWGRITSDQFYIFLPTVKDDSTATALKAYRYAIDDGEVRNVSISPTTSVNETLKFNLPSLANKPIVYGDCSYYVDNPEAGKVTMNRPVYYDLSMQYQNESGVWSDLENSRFSMSQSVTKDVRTVNVGESVEIPEKPIGGTFEVVKFDIETTDDYSLRASEGCELTIKTASGTTHTYHEGAAQMVESYRAHYAAGTYYAMIYNSLKNMANPSNGLILTLQSICKKPEITVTNDGTHVATISSETEGTSIYYTLDGSNPTVNSIKYDGEFVVPHNGWIKAIAAKDGYGISYIDSIRVTGIQTATPVASFEHPYLTLTCETPDATIYYSVGSTYYDDYKKYTEPVKLEENTVVYFKATSPNLDESSRGFYTPTTFVCKTPEFEFNGKYLKVKSSDNSYINYTETTTDEKPQYFYNSVSSGDSIFVSDTIIVWACASHDRLGNSDTVKYVVPAVFEGNDYYAKVRTSGQLATALKWTETQKYKVTRLRVSGNINHADIAKIKEQENLVELDLSEATVEETTLPDDAFAGLKNLLYFVSPANLTSAGARLLDGCDDLGGIDWRSSCTVPSDILGGKEYANLILFVDTEEQAAKSICKNIVVGGNIENITLVDADERAGFFAPRSFYVTGTMSYTRSFTQPTLLTGECQGWEAICLPFSPTTYTHESQGECTPFDNWSADDDTRKPFWLNGFDYSGFVSTWGLYDNYPRIISLPNNDQYADEFILGGNMTFSISNTTVDATQLRSYESNGYRFVSNFTNKPADESRSVINSYEEYNGYKMGSVFVPGLRGAKAFEPYFEYANADGNYAKLRGPEIGVDDGTTGIETIPMRLTDKDVYSENGKLYINSSSERDAYIYNIGGQLVRKLHLTQGVNEVNGISKGVYVINKIKLIIK